MSETSQKIGKIVSIPSATTNVVYAFPTRVEVDSNYYHGQPKLQQFFASVKKNQVKT